MDERERSGSRRLSARDGSDAGRARAGVVALVALVAGTLVAVAPGLVSPATALGETPVVFSTPGFYEYEVPSGVGSLAVTVAGGHGGASWTNRWGGGDGWTTDRSPASGGRGGRVDAVISVSPGDELGITVGEDADLRWGGVGGGGNGGHWEWDLWTGSEWVTAEAEGGGGGGASSIADLAIGEPLVVGGGGGGGGITFFADEYQYQPDDEFAYSATCDSFGVIHPASPPENGGDGGGHGTPNGSDGCYKSAARTNGRGATTSGPGTGWGPSGDGWDAHWDGYYARGGDGSSGLPGGGGGGGYYGAAGGGEDAGGGGSSYAIPEATGVQYSLNTGYYDHDALLSTPRSIFDGFVIVTPVEGSGGGSTTTTTVPSGEPSDDCKANGGERVVDSTTAGVFTMLYVDQPASDEVEVCVRVEDSSGDGYGGKLAVTPGEVDPGVGGGVPSTDSESGACSSTTPNLVPGSHPVAHGGVSSVDYMIDVYASSSEAWLCLEVDPPGTNVRVKVPVGVPGVTLGGDPVTWYPDDGTPG